jgi:hypothetical protein
MWPIIGLLEKKNRRRQRGRGRLPMGWSLVAVTMAKEANS